MNTPLVSIIMPLYNKRAYVRRAIDSVRNQTHENWELIIVDDGSTDGSPAVVPSDDSRIRLFRQTNAGPSAARNNGISKARGEFVSFLDADDYYYPHKLEKEVQYLHEEKRAEWMLSGPKFRDSKGEVLTPRVTVFDDGLHSLSIAGKHINTMSISKNLLQRLGGFNEQMRCYEIAEFMIRCVLLQPKVFTYPHSLCRIVKVSDSAFTVLSHRIEGLRILAESVFSLANQYPDFENILAQRSRQQYLSYVTALIRSGEHRIALSFLIREYPHSYDKRWLKLLILASLPRLVSKRIV